MTLPTAGLVLFSLAAALALPYLTYRLDPGRRRIVLLLTATLVAILSATAALSGPTSRPAVLHVLGPIALGLIVSLYLALLGSPRVSLSTKYGATTALVSLPIFVSAEGHLANGTSLIIGDVSTRAFVLWLEWLHVPATPRLLAATDEAIRQIQTNVVFLQRHGMGVASFLVLAAGWIVLEVIQRVLPGLLGERLSLSSLRHVALLGRRTSLPLLVSLAALDFFWPGEPRPTHDALDLLLGVFGAEGLSTLLLLAAAVRPARLWVAALLCVCLGHLPWSVLLCLVGVIEVALGIRSLLPPIRGDKAPSRFGPRAGPRRIASSLAVVLVVFALLQVLIALGLQKYHGVDKELAVALGPQAPAGPAADPRMGGMVYVPRPGRPFFVDRYEHSDEPGDRPTTGVTSRGARESCERDGKRLCDEKEWQVVCISDVPEEIRAKEPGRGCPAAGQTPDPAEAPPCDAKAGVHGMAAGLWEWTTPVSRGPLDHFMVLKGTSQYGIDEMEEMWADCSYRRFVHASQEGSIDLSTVGYRCCRDVPAAGNPPGSEHRP